MNRLKKILRTLAVPGFFLAFLAATYWIYPLCLSFIPQQFEVQSRSLNVVGYFYPLVLDGVSSVRYENGEITVQGFDAPWFQMEKKAPISRSLPNKYLGQYSRDTSWNILPLTISPVTGLSYRVFIHSTTQDTFKVGLPAWNDYPTWAAYKTPGDTTLIVLAAGNFKRGEKVYLGYIVISKRI